MNEPKNIFSWVKTHQELAQYLLTQEDNQIGLIELLQKQGIEGLTEEDPKGIKIEPLEIDPFTFFCFIYKYGPERRLKILQDIASILNLTVPNDTTGIPAVNSFRVRMFPLKFNRKNNEIKRLWSFFKSALNNTITDEQFIDILEIENIAKVKLTEVLFFVDPIKYLPLDGPTIPYIKDILKIDTGFKNYSDYLNILKKVKEKSNLSFYELSYESWNYKSKNCNFWIFQCNPDMFDLVKALDENLVDNWTVSAHKDKIKEGDKAIIWMTGDEAGCYALADVMGVPEIIDQSKDDHLWKENHKSDTKVKIEITHNFSDRPIYRSQIADVKSLSGFKGGNQGTNFQSTKEEYDSFLSLSEDRTGVRYWIYAPGKSGEKWDEFFDLGIMAIGWDFLGDLTQYNDKKDIVAKLQMAENTTGSKKNDATANFEFCHIMKLGDVVFAKKGKTDFIGYGIVQSDYYFDESRSEFKSCRKVNWIKKGNWKDRDIVLKTLTDITYYPEYYKRLLELLGVNSIQKANMITYPLNTIFYGPPGTGKTYHTIKRAAEIVSEHTIEHYQDALKVFKEHLGSRIEFITFHQNYSYSDFIQGLRPDTENGNQLTFQKKDGIFKKIAESALKNLVESEKDPKAISKSLIFDEALEKLKDKIIDSEQKIFINETAYFIAVEDDALRYSADNWTLNDKGFNGFRMKFTDLKKFYEVDIKSRKEIKELAGISGLAKQHASYFIKAYELVKSLINEDSYKDVRIEKQNYVIIIDEINRANISRVFGELITLIEPDKRSHGDIPLKCTLPSGDEFIVPSNLYIIGTMNTADKSIALLDIALRRRFEFEAMYPKYAIEGKLIYDTEVLQKINASIIKKKGHDFQIGHSYFMDASQELVDRMNKKVIPLLLEYFMNDQKEVEEILKDAGLEVDKNEWPIKIKGKL